MCRSEHVTWQAHQLLCCLWLFCTSGGSEVFGIALRFSFCHFHCLGCSGVGFLLGSGDVLGLQGEELRIFENSKNALN